MALLSGTSSDLANFARVAQEEVGEWLAGYDGYRGLIVLTAEQDGRARIITLWDSTRAEERSRDGRGAMRDRIALAAGMAVEAVELYEAPICEVL
jgi:hypothetical protein